jgi:hypothetical protein
MASRSPKTSNPEKSVEREFLEVAIRRSQFLRAGEPKKANREYDKLYRGETWDRRNVHSVTENCVHSGSGPRGRPPALLGHQRAVSGWLQRLHEHLGSQVARVRRYR